MVVRCGGVEIYKAKNPGEFTRRGFCLLLIYYLLLLLSLTITYFHTGCSTIIGAKSFHGPVRDGKGWDRLAMVIRHNLYEPRVLVEHAALNLEEVGFVLVVPDQQTALYSYELYLLRL